MGSLVTFSEDLSINDYYDKSSGYTKQQYSDLKAVSSTIYVSHFAFHTPEAQLYEIFSLAGPIKRIKMGINRIDNKFAGFCFIEYFTHDAALAALNLYNCRIDISKHDGNKQKERQLTIDLDPGFKDGRQFGRGKTGNQKGDERNEFNEDRPIDLPSRDHFRRGGFRDKNQYRGGNYNHSF